MRETSLSNAERLFAQACVEGNRRLDGRSNKAPRRVTVTLGPQWGFAEVHFDSTIAVARTSVEAVTPPPDRSSEGTIAIALDLSPTSSERSARESMHRPTGTLAVELRNCVERFVRESRAIDTEALCVLAGVKVWAVCVDVDVINDDGNCIDVCMMAVMASLLHARRPDVTVSGREVRVHSVEEREPVPLPVHHVPLSVSFALFGAGKPYEDDLAVLDPIKKEEMSANGALSFAFNAQGEVCGVYKAGGLPLQHRVFSTCAALAEKRALQLTGVLKQALSDASVQHPLSTVRPMLVNPEPTAVLKTEGYAKEKGAAVGLQAAAMWNAAPAADSAPPTMEVDGEDQDGMQGVASTREEREREERRKVVEELLVSDGSSSDDDDLADAVISKPRGGGGRPKRKR